MDSWYDKNRIVNERRKQNQEYKKVADKKKLRDDIRKKITTTMIGALDDFEKEFGELWGISKDDDADLTESELRFDEMYTAVRKSILDRGHSQINALLEELENYDINWNRYRYNFIIKD